MLIRLGYRFLSLCKNKAGTEKVKRKKKKFGRPERMFETLGKRRRKRRMREKERAMRRRWKKSGKKVMRERRRLRKDL